jgi:5-methylcytosine-specific restriction protein A
MRTVIGIDPSFSGLGLCAIPSDWSCSLDRVFREVLEVKTQPLVDRIAKLAIDVCGWVGHFRSRGPVDIWIEGGITGGKFAHTVRMQIELAACIKHEIWRELGIEVRVAEQSTARKLFLGAVPADDRKDAIIAAFERLWPGAEWEADEIEALVAANHGLAVGGQDHVANLAFIDDRFRRVPKAAGFCNPAELPKGPNGFNLCRQCSKEVSSRQRTFCGAECVAAWKLKTQPAYARRKVEDRDAGVCARCQVDTKTEAQEVGPYGHRWEMDHIIPVIEGGGSCGLENLRTLCIPCHREVTKELARRRSRARRAAKKNQTEMA